jgi:hypothetical protein
LSSILTTSAIFNTPGTVAKYRVFSWPFLDCGTSRTFACIRPNDFFDDGFGGGGGEEEIVVVTILGCFGTGGGVTMTAGVVVRKGMAVVALGGKGSCLKEKKK